RHDRAALPRHRFEGPRDVAAAAERDQHGVFGDRGIHDALHVVFVGRVDDHIDGALDAVGADAHEVAQALAVGVYDTLHGIRGHEVGADDIGEARKEGG